MKKVILLSVVVAILVGIYPIMAGAKTQELNLLDPAPASGAVVGVEGQEGQLPESAFSEQANSLYQAPNRPGTVVGVVDQDRYSREDAFAEELNRLYSAGTREETIATFEGASDDGEWFNWFNSLTEEEQGQVDQRPEYFAVIQRTIYDKDTLWGFRVNFEWYDWFHSLTAEEQREVYFRPERFAQIQREVYGIDTLDGGTYTEVRENLPLKFYKLDESYSNTNEISTDGISIEVDETGFENSYVNSTNSDSYYGKAILTNVSNKVLLPKVSSLALSSNVSNMSLPMQWSTYASNGNFCSITYVSGTTNSAKVQITFINSSYTGNQVAIRPIHGTWTNMYGYTLGLPQAVNATYTINNLYPSLAYQIRAKTFDGSVWRECVLDIKADDGRMPTGGSEPVYDYWAWSTIGTNPYDFSNCYTYALGFYSNSISGVATPGMISGMSLWWGNDITEANWKMRVENDMRYMFNTSNLTSYWTPIQNYQIPGNRGWRVAGYLDLSGSPREFHFYRQDAQGCWSHKWSSGNPCSNIDGFGNIIVDPNAANRLVLSHTYQTWAQSTNYYYAFSDVNW